MILKKRLERGEALSGPHGVEGLHSNAPLQTRRVREERGLGPLFPGHRETDGWEWVPPFLLLGLALPDLTCGCMCTSDSVYFVPLFLRWGFL